MINDGVAYQGLVYREAVTNVEHYLLAKGHQPHYFIGFNALNTAEQQLVQAFLENGNAEMFWDAEHTFVADDAHSASMFLRRYMKQWNYYATKKPRFITNYYAQSKDINLVSCTKNMSQVKFIGQLLQEYPHEKLSNTAIVLADEALLIPLLHSLPANVVDVNVTMGAALKNFPISVFFETWLLLHTKNSTSFYYKDLLKIIGHPAARKILDAKQLVTAITSENKSQYTLASLLNISKQKDKEILQMLFSPVNDDPKKVLEIGAKIIEAYRISEKNSTIEHVVLYEVHKVFEALNALTDRFNHVGSLKSLQGLFKELVDSTTIDFKGDAFDGLQIMGVLETRSLDFENIIVLSVNEGILPSGKSNASFITYDLKKEFNLPQYVEKDAIYTYHFYDLLHRAKEVTLVYTNFSEGLSSGEKSRFILQLELALQPNHTLRYTTVSPDLALSVKTAQVVEKTPSVLTRVKEIASKGFSPSALTSYIRNPIDFYYQKVLRVNEFEEVEETVAHNTLGTIVHDTLEKLYEPLVGMPLTHSMLEEIKKNAGSEVRNQFAESFQGGDISKGKNLLIFEVAKRYVHNIITMDLAEIANGHELIIRNIESNLRIPIAIHELDFPVYLHGKVDRVDSLNGQLRIIDYKTGKVTQGQLELFEWATLTEDYKFSKAFQVLSYALMMYEEHPFATAEAGIISCKNLAGGFLKFGTKESPRSRQKNYSITSETIASFTVELKKLILEICEPSIPFTEKEID